MVRPNNRWLDGGGTLAHGAESPADLDEAQPQGVELHAGVIGRCDDCPRRMVAVEVVP